MIRFLVVICLWSPCAVQYLDDRHLGVLARTTEESARIAEVLAPPADSSKAEAFEDNPAGAATVRVLMNADAFSQPSAKMSLDRENDFKRGTAQFRKT